MEEVKYKYHIFPDRVYVLTYEETTYEIKGEDILAMFRRDAMWDVWFKDIND